MKPNVIASKPVTISPPLRSIKPPARPAGAATQREVRNEALPTKGRGTPGADHSVQRSFGTTQPTPLINFEGVDVNDDGTVTGELLEPPDTEGYVGANHYFQWNNIVFKIFDKSGNLVLGPIPGNAFWSGAGNACEQQNNGDPIVMYDQAADRWVAGQFAFPADGTSHECVAVSVTGDPTGSYYQYDFETTDATGFGDYPKMAVWPDAYYLTVNNFSAEVHPRTFALDRTNMLAGNTASEIFFDIANPAQIVVGGVLATSQDSSLPPPIGAPNPQFAIGHPALDGSSGPVLHEFLFHVDFGTPANSTLTQLPDLPVDDFNPTLCGFPPAFTRSCVPELEAVNGVDALNDRLLYRSAYRNFGDHEAVVLSHTVNVGDGSDQAGVRWYEVRDPEGSPTVYQQGSYAPDSTWRWMGSIAMDVSGDIALGYSKSDATIFPAIGVTGRLATDPLGQMGDEAIMFAGTGSQDGPYGRWGDYSSMTVDPVDGCTFWYTQEYIPANGDFNWNTRIGSFKFDSCVPLPTGTLEGTVTDGTNPISNATVIAGSASTQTDASGHYSFTLAVGSYDMTASKYGFLPQSVPGVAVTNGGDTVQPFVLAPAPTTMVNGTVKDGSGGGWPLYAQIVVTGSGAPPQTIFTDPVTGYYSVTLVDGLIYNFAVTALVPGYNPGGGPLNLMSTKPATPTGLVANWSLTVQAVACNAPGYSITGMETVFSEGFDSGELPAGWTVTNNSSPGPYPVWFINTGADPCSAFAGNDTGGSGPYALVDSNCDGSGTSIDSSLVTPSQDLSAFGALTLSFNQEYINLGDNADVDVSTDGGTTWQNVLAQTATVVGPNQVNLDISGVAGGQSNVQFRFHNYNAFFAWWWQVDDVMVAAVECTAGTGGLIVGNVTDANSGAGLIGANVADMTYGGTTTTFATSNDPNQPKGLYVLYGESGANTVQASMSQYAPDSHSPTVIPNSTVRQDFVLKAGQVGAAPSSVDGRVNPGGTDNKTLTLSNTGGAAASFTLVELNVPALPNNTFGFVPEAIRRANLARLGRSWNPKHPAKSTEGLPRLINLPSRGRPLAAGDVIASYPSNLSIGWGVASDTSNFWLSNLGPAYGGDNKDYQYGSTTGAQTGKTIDDSVWAPPTGFAADGAFDVKTGMMWRVAAGGDNCLHEMNPTTQTVTGNTVCGSWTAVDQRGLAYDQVNDAFFVGGWNEMVVYHVDMNGNVLDSANVGLPISGLAYAPNTGHLLVMSNTNGAVPDVTVLDALNNYAVIGSFNIMNNGSPAMTQYGQAGMEFDCLGNLWVIDQNTQTIYNVASGENVACQIDIPWLTEDPTTGTLDPGSASTQPIALTFSGGSLLPGLRQAQLRVQTDTPYSLPAVPVTLTVRFLDVPDNNQFQAFIYGAAGAGVMMGGPPNCPAGVLDFCPNNTVTRADMAGYIFRAVHGANTPPPVYQNIFSDVSFNDYNSFYIQGIFDDGITAGCGGGNYCPTFVNTRAQMSVFIWKGQHGSAAPPACTTQVFGDVPCGSFAADYINALYAEGVTAGCGGGNFCPDSSITNGQMAVFLVKGFNIPHLP